MNAQPVDVIFDRPRTLGGLRVVWAIAAALSVHAGLVGAAMHAGPSLETWAEGMMRRVHVELESEYRVTLDEPPPPPAPPPPPPPPEVPRPEPVAQQARAPTAAPPVPVPLASAARVLSNDDPLDFSSDSFVTGDEAMYAGGASASSGKSKTAVEVVPPPPPRASALPSEPDRSSPVTLSEEDDDWHCPWPTEAEDEALDAQVVLVEVEVRADGRVASGRLLRDPGHGFGEAALRCARTKIFVPAKDRDGRAIARTSPPIRVQFTR